MSDTIIIAILSLCGTCFGSIVGIIKASKLTEYRISLLEKRFSDIEEKVDKHNNVVERIALLEHDEKTQWLRIDELKERIDKYHE